MSQGVNVSETGVRIRKLVERFVSTYVDTIIVKRSLDDAYRYISEVEDEGEEKKRLLTLLEVSQRIVSQWCDMALQKFIDQIVEEVVKDLKTGTGSGDGEKHD